MTTPHILKSIGAATIALTFISGAALAGDKKDCDHKKTTAMQKTEVSAPTAVLPAAATTEKAKMEHKTYTFEEAKAKCQKYGAEDLQACIDKKTGVAKPKS